MLMKSQFMMQSLDSHDTGMCTVWEGARYKNMAENVE